MPKSLCTETVQSAARPLERINNVESGNCFPLGMLGVCYRVTNDLSQTRMSEDETGWQGNTHVFQENLEDTTCLLVDETRNTLHTTTTCKTTNGWLCDTCKAT